MFSVSKSPLFFGPPEECSHCSAIPRTSKSEQAKSLQLKVDGNEKQWGPGRRQMLGNGLLPLRSRFMFNLNMQFLSKMSYLLSRL